MSHDDLSAAHPEEEAFPSEVQIEQLARALHDSYRELHRERHDPDDAAMQPWEQLDASLAHSNRELARDIPRKLKAIQARAVLAEQQRPFTFTPAELERLSAAEHDRWMHERKAEGWKPGKRDTKKKRSPYLVPYQQLSYEVQDWDRRVVRAIPGALAEMGYRIERATKPRVFVIRDFTTHHVDMLLQAAVKNSDAYEWDCPGVTDKVPTGEIPTDVRNRIYRAHYVLASVDEPNGNVGLEVGHALGRGARLALFHVQADGPPAWLNLSPFEAYGVHPVHTRDDILALLDTLATAELADLLPPPAVGDAIVILAPRLLGSNEVAQEITKAVERRGREVRLIQEPEWNWRDAPVELAGAGQVLFCYDRPPHDDGKHGRDGGPNTVHAAIAGYLGAYDVRKPIVLQHADVKRRLGDFGGSIRVYNSLENAVQVAEKALGL